MSHLLLHNNRAFNLPLHVEKSEQKCADKGINTSSNAKLTAKRCECINQSPHVIALCLFCDMTKKNAN
jgi:hypothetical protein